jgi:hypothetical protein
MPRLIRPIRAEGNLAFIPLTQGLEAIIDASDIEIAEGRNWFAHKDHYTFYVKTTKKGFKHVKLRLHNEIINPPEGFTVDHVNGDGLDNRRSNLRLATIHENNRNCRIRKDNKSGKKGVSWHKRSNKWVAKIKYGGKPIYLGSYETIDDAYVAYCKALERLHGEFGRAE